MLPATCLWYRQTGQAPAQRSPPALKGISHTLPLWLLQTHAPLKQDFILPVRLGAAVLIALHIPVGRAQVPRVGCIPHNCSWRIVLSPLAPEGLCIHTFRGQLARVLWQVTTPATQALGPVVSPPPPAAEKHLSECLPELLAAEGVDEGVSNGVAHDEDQEEVGVLEDAGAGGVLRTEDGE